ncbi:hypothetical protein [Ramlibacter sp. WS9]|uniref:hypothetical protein n=1 Tax=Ramlibacter sp. WS9 TaxID=1882741 RepID=UPI00130531A7|nr:hypothetical protein [Ramlibacter sp. WS9]
MRFSAAIQPQQPLRTSAASDFIRRIVSGQLPHQQQPEPVDVKELPADLDQRVRLVGEW